jgi:hypothetical protein
MRNYGASAPLVEAAPGPRQSLKVRPHRNTTTFPDSSDPRGFNQQNRFSYQVARSSLQQRAQAQQREVTRDSAARGHVIRCVAMTVQTGAYGQCFQDTHAAIRFSVTAANFAAGPLWILSQCYHPASLVASPKTRDIR